MTVEYAIVQTLRYFIPSLFSMLFRIFGLGYKDKKHARIGFIAFCLYMLLVPCGLILLMGHYNYTKIAFLVMTVGNLVVFYISGDGFLKTAFMHVTQVNVVFLLSILCNAARHILGLKEETMLLVLPVIYFFAFLIGMRYFAKPFRFMAENIQSGWEVLLVIPVITLFIGLTVTVYSGAYFGNQPVFDTMTVVLIESCFFLYVAVLYKNLLTITKLAHETIDREMLRLSAESMRTQIELTQKEYKLSMQNVDQIRRMRHDMNHHLSVLSAYLHSGNPDEAQRYIEQISAQIPDKPISDKNLITASFISKYSQLCAEHTIAFSSNVAWNEDSIKDKFALGTLLGNALQNAYEAANKAKEEKRFISISGQQIHNYLVLIVKNGYNGKLNKNYQTTKKGGMHGLGLLSMKQITDAHNGYMEIAHTVDKFTVTLAIASE